MGIFQIAEVECIIGWTEKDEGKLHRDFIFPPYLLQSVVLTSYHDFWNMIVTRFFFSCSLLILMCGYIEISMYDIAIKVNIKWLYIVVNCDNCCIQMIEVLSLDVCKSYVVRYSTTEYDMTILVCGYLPGMGTHMLESTLQTKCMGLECINLRMGIGMKERGMKVEGKVLECTHLGMEKPKQAIGIMEYLMSQAHKTRRVLYLQLLLIIPKY